MRHVTLGRPAEAQGSGDLRLIVAYIVPIAGHDLYGLRPGFPPAAGLDPGVLWSRRQLAVGASVPHTDGFLVANLLLVLKRQGIGSPLMALTGQAVLDRSPSSGLYLWVLEQNSDARAFYAARGGNCVERGDVPPPGGDPVRLNGKPMCLRYAWRDVSKLLLGRQLQKAD